MSSGTCISRNTYVNGVADYDDLSPRGQLSRRARGCPPCDVLVTMLHVDQIVPNLWVMSATGSLSVLHGGLESPKHIFLYRSVLVLLRSNEARHASMATYSLLVHPLSPRR